MLFLFMNKKIQRQQAYQDRNEQSDKEKLSRIICEKFIAQPSYQQAETIMWYLHCRSEVKTINTLLTEFNPSKRFVIPYCTKTPEGVNKLGLWLFEGLPELSAGTWGILEPEKSRWGEVGKEVLPDELDLIMVPGVAFDRNGGRLGNGAGYYDRLLQEVRSDTILTGVCFESQICQKVVMEKHDVLMNNVITETNNYHPKNGFDTRNKSA